MNPLFLRLIHPFPIKEPLKVQKNDLQEIKALSLNHNLFPLIYTQLQKYRNLISPEQVISDFLEQSQGLYLKSAALSMQQEAVENEIGSFLGNKGIPSVVIKGNKIAREIYDDPNSRTSSDIDILIRREDAEVVDKLLREAGYIAEADIPLKYCLSRIHHVIYYHPHNNMLVEIHWGFGVPYFFKLDSEEIWDEGIISESGDSRLSPEMLMFMLLIHHHSHSFRELKILVDIMWVMWKYEDVIDWHLFALKIKKAGLIRTTIITLNQMRSLWGKDIDQTEAGRILEQELADTGHGVPAILLSYFRMDIDSDKDPNMYKDKLVARLALDRLSTTVLSYFRTLFPVPEAIKELYKDRRNWSLPFNYLKFIKWRVKEWMGI